MQNSEKCRAYLKKRFGVTNTLEDYRFVERSGDFWIIPSNMDLDEEYITAGIRALRDTGIGLKPTTYFLQILGEKISRNKYKLDRDTFERLVLKREVIDNKNLENGYVALEFRGKIIGCGLKRNSGLVTQIPKGRTGILQDIIKDE